MPEKTWNAYLMFWTKPVVFIHKMNFSENGKKSVLILNLNDKCKEKPNSAYNASKLYTCTESLLNHFWTYGVEHGNQLKEQMPQKF